MSKPFEELHSDLNLLQYHPESDLLKKALLSAGHKERLGIASLWLSEGIPHAFLSTPAVYQQLRSDFSKKFGIGFKDVSVVGSSRFGYSLADYKFGEKFGEQSDLDLCIINSELFEKIKFDTEKFVNDVIKGITTADRPHAQKLWEASCENLSDNIAKGFIDVKKVPAIAGKYNFICEIKHKIYLIDLRLKNTKNIPQFKDISIRFYRDWPSMTDQVARSLFRLTKKLEVA